MELVGGVEGLLSTGPTLSSLSRVPFNSTSLGRGRTESSDEDGDFNDAGSMISEVSEASTVRQESGEEGGVEELKGLYVFKAGAGHCGMDWF